MSGSIGFQVDETDWLGEALKAGWLPDSLLSRIGDQAKMVRGRTEMDAKLYTLFESCKTELHVCTHEPFLLNQISQFKQVLQGLKVPPPLFLYTQNDAVAKAGFQLSDILKIVNIQKTKCAGHFVAFDDRSALIFLAGDPAKTDRLLHVESTYAVSVLKKLAQN